MLRAWKIEIVLDGKSDKALYLQIADAIIADIRSGRLRSGDALPGSRNLAEMLKLNRNTVVDALNVLLIEGWLVSRERKGTFVTDELPVLKAPKRQVQFAIEPPDLQPKKQIRFDDGHPDSKIAPVAELARAYRQIFQAKAKWQMMSYGDSLGDTGFRREIANMLNHQRKMQTTENNVCITRGSQMAMYLTAHCLFSQDDYVMVENPGYKPAWTAFESAGAKLLPVEVDDEGLSIAGVVAHLKSGKRIRAIYTTPHRQYPTTVSLSLQRRLELVRLSNAHGFTIIEDDYDNEFHFGFRPLHPLSSMPELKNYVYVGTLSKVVAPALRIGYLATANTELIRKVAELRKIIDVQGDNIMEQAVLQLIKDGTIKRHIRKASNFYKSKRDLTAALIHKYLGEKVEYSIPDGGLAFWLKPNKIVNWSMISRQLESKGVFIASPETFSYKGAINGVRLGYGSLSEERFKQGIVELSKLL
jgi:GntR family transcriptional regulator / MocR family aminotransferase